MTTVSAKVAQIISITQVIWESGLWRACQIGLQTGLGRKCQREPFRKLWKQTVENVGNTEKLQFKWEFETFVHGTVLSEFFWV